MIQLIDELLLAFLDHLQQIYIVLYRMEYLQQSFHHLLNDLGVFRPLSHVWLINL